MKISTICNYFKPLVDFFGSLLDGLAKPFQSGRPASTVEKRAYNPLKLDIQFFAEKSDGDNPDNNDLEDDNDDKGGGSNKDQDPDKTDPDEDNQENEPTLNELFKKHPKLKEEYGKKFKKDFNKRLKGLDLEEARKAVDLIEKLGLSADDGEKKKDKDDSDSAPDNSKANRLEKKAKDLSLKLFASSEGYDAKLISALASNRLESLDLNDDGELDSEDLEEIVDDLKEEFPAAFVAKDDDKDDKKKKDKNFNPGGRQKTNPAPKKTDAAVNARKRIERLRGVKKK